MAFLKAQHPLAAAIVFGEAAKLTPADPALLLGLGIAVRSSAGVLVTRPFVEWSVRILKRCIELDAHGDHGRVAGDRLAALACSPDYADLPAIEPADLDVLVAFLDVAPATVLPDAISALPDDDRMFAIMSLAELRSPRFWSAIAAAISGTWGLGPARSALKRVAPYGHHRAVRTALASLRASPRGEDCDPYLHFAERLVADIPITEPTAPPPTAPRRWWRLW
ncbi:MAG: hypothetical protein KIT31_39250 [Deltaproteobacteria bacterium]|nr:hypothetical protein [Deltaproteobacteria bacterium]